MRSRRRRFARHRRRIRRLAVLVREQIRRKLGLFPGLKDDPRDRRRIVISISESLSIDGDVRELADRFL